MYRIEVRHEGLNKYRVITGREKRLVEEKARAKLALWNEQWSKRIRRNKNIFLKDQKKKESRTRTEECKSIILELEQILISCLENKAKDKWDQLKFHGSFDQTAPERPIIPDFPREPQISDFFPKTHLLDFFPKTRLLDKIFSARRSREVEEANSLLVAQHMRWEEECAGLRRQKSTANANYTAKLQEWLKTRDEFEDARLRANDAVDDLCTRYKVSDPAAIKEYSDLVLSNSEYPDCFPREWILEFDLETSTLVVEFRLPSLADMPTLKEVKYVVSSDAFAEVRLSENSIKALYDSVVYQVCLRTLHELFSNDQIQALRAVVFNGWVNYIDPATGQETQACIMTVQALAGQFNKINLAAVDPKACFRSLKGVGSTQLHAMAPVQPLLKLNRTDHRFIASVDVASRIDEGTNIAAIGWEEFEHLIREIFEREFSHNGGEVKVTQTSRDGGVDAVAFDPDPIRGGKIVIQAKRYTNPVDVSAVRDLYGTVVNEGATKGILVTTSKFGPDAYNFAKDKPLTLMDGVNGGDKMCWIAAG